VAFATLFQLPRQAGRPRLLRDLQLPHHPAVADREPGDRVDPPRRPRVAYTVGALVVNVGVAIGLDRCVRMPWRLSTRMLSQRVFVAIGRVSYSLYLWQQIFVDRSSRAWWTSFPRNALLAGLVAFASYWLIEQPSMSVRRTLQDWFARLFPPRARIGVPGPRSPKQRAA